MLALLSLLQTRRELPGSLLAQRLAVSDRTVRRDVDRLRELGYRVSAAMGPAGGYRLEAGADLPPLLFDDEQAVALAVALRTAAASGADVGEAAERALASVRQLLPARLRARVDALEVDLGDPRPSADPQVLLALTTAVRAREGVRFSYGDGDRVRRVEPHHVVARAGRWYLVGWDGDGDDWRTFRVDRIALRTPGGPRFSRRALPGDVDVATWLGARAKGSSGTDTWPCVGSAVLDLEPHEVAPYVGDATLEPLPDGRCRLVAGSWSWTGLVGLLTRFDVDLSEVEPAELRGACAEVARRLSSSSSPAGGRARPWPG
ncbi:WYL domain-containing protein [Nocardioides anomalus]|uniref:WYL domain-containing protein n=2 Tax=Nocardioides anomalus TaxID=2712223 RepID=A0A6G6WK32_9ACTN|nr:WYL domain-containing protein [Nocardioides anomalus]